MRDRDVRDLLRANWPDLVIEHVDDLGEGDFSRAYLVNGEWVVRIAKHREAARSLAREACLLPRIAGHVDLSVPHPEVVIDESEWAFNAHRLMPGPRLTKEAFDGLPDATRKGCADQ